MKKPIYAMRIKKCITVLLITLNLFNFSCDKSDDVKEDTPKESSVDFEEVLFDSFPLSELDQHHGIDTSIEHPELINGTPQEKGKITIELAFTSISKFSLKHVSFKDSDFTISPKVGAQSIIAGETITYTITSTKDDSVTLQYDVLVTIKDKIEDPANEKLAINEFSFLKVNNSGFSEDIPSAEIRKYNHDNRHDAVIVVTVPNNTNFSNLVPTIGFEGSFITYHTNINGNHSDFKEFKEGTVLDFKHPNIITLRIYNSDKSKFHTSHVYVDIKDPIVFDDLSATINGGNMVSGFNSYDNVISFTNNGNYPIERDIKAFEIEVTKTPEATPVNYYLRMILRSDKKIHTGDKGKLYVQLNFPSEFKGTTTGLDSYDVNVQFKTMLNRGRIVPFSTLSAANKTDFYIYNPTEKIEVKATVYVKKP